MANEDKKDFNAMLHDNKDMPKFQTITDQKTIEKYGGSKMYFAPPINYDKVMKTIPYGKVITVGKIREYFAKLSDADFFNLPLDTSDTSVEPPPISKIKPSLI